MVRAVRHSPPRNGLRLQSPVITACKSHSVRIDDSNPYNNLGQENTQVGVCLSPVSFEFQLGNRKQSTQELRFETGSLPSRLYLVRYDGQRG